MLVAEVDFREGLAVEIDQLVRTKYDRGTQFQQAVVGKGLDDQLGSDPVHVSHRYANKGPVWLIAHALIFRP
jgi:hypothetical protein